MDWKILAFAFLLLTPFISAKNIGWTGDTYSMLVRLIGFKAPWHTYSSQNFAVEWVKQNPDGSLTVHLVEVS